MNDLKYTTQSMLNKYEVLWKKVRKKHGDNLEQALEEIIELENDEISLFSKLVDEDIKLSEQKVYKTKTASLDILLAANQQKNQAKSELSQAAFFRAIKAFDMAKNAHMDHLLHDTRIIFGKIKNDLKNECENQSKSRNDGSEGGDIYAKKSEDAVYLALELWLICYQNHSIRRASNLIVEKVNTKIIELNINISRSQYTSNTPIPPATEYTVSTWVSAFKHHINQTPKDVDPRKCIKFYYDNYFLNDKLYFELKL